MISDNEMTGYSVCKGSWRFTQWGRDGEGGFELYDNSKDGAGYYNLADRREYSDVRKQLAGLLKKGFPVLD